MMRAAVALGVVVMIGLIVGLDVAFLRHHAALRLVVNVAIVASFGVGYVLVKRRR
jgi:hypothetical protein